eukprot:EG_transcript_777
MLFSGTAAAWPPESALPRHAAAAAAATPIPLPMAAARISHSPVSQGISGEYTSSSSSQATRSPRLVFSPSHDREAPSTQRYYFSEQTSTWTGVVSKTATEIISGHLPQRSPTARTSSSPGLQPVSHSPTHASPVHPAPYARVEQRDDVRFPPPEPPVYAAMHAAPSSSPRTVPTQSVVYSSSYHPAVADPAFPAHNFPFPLANPFQPPYSQRHRSPAVLFGSPSAPAERAASGASAVAHPVHFQSLFHASGAEGGDHRARALSYQPAGPRQPERPRSLSAAPAVQSAGRYVVAPAPAAKRPPVARRLSMDGTLSSLQTEDAIVWDVLAESRRLSAAAPSPSSLPESPASAIGGGLGGGYLSASLSSRSDTYGAEDRAAETTALRASSYSDSHKDVPPMIRYGIPSSVVYQRGRNLVRAPPPAVPPSLHHQPPLLHSYAPHHRAVLPFPPEGPGPTRTPSASPGLQQYAPSGRQPAARATPAFRASSPGLQLTVVKMQAPAAPKPTPTDGPRGAPPLGVPAAGAKVGAPRGFNASRPLTVKVSRLASRPNGVVPIAHRDVSTQYEDPPASRGASFSRRPPEASPAPELADATVRPAKAEAVARPVGWQPQPFEERLALGQRSLQQDEGLMQQVARQQLWVNKHFQKEPGAPPAESPKERLPDDEDRGSRPPPSPPADVPAVAKPVAPDVPVLATKSTSEVITRDHSGARPPPPKAEPKPPPAKPQLADLAQLLGRHQVMADLEFLEEPQMQPQKPPPRAAPPVSPPAPDGDGLGCTPPSLVKFHLPGEEAKPAAGPPLDREASQPKDLDTSQRVSSDAAKLAELAKLLGRHQIMADLEFVAEPQMQRDIPVITTATEEEGDPCSTSQSRVKFNLTPDDSKYGSLLHLDRAASSFLKNLTWTVSEYIGVASEGSSPAAELSSPLAELKQEDSMAKGDHFNHSLDTVSSSSSSPASDEYNGVNEIDGEVLRATSQVATDRPAVLVTVEEATYLDLCAPVQQHRLRVFIELNGHRQSTKAAVPQQVASNSAAGEILAVWSQGLSIDAEWDEDSTLVVSLVDDHKGQTRTLGGGQVMLESIPVQEGAITVHVPLWGHFEAQGRRMQLAGCLRLMFELLLTP